MKPAILGTLLLSFVACGALVAQQSEITANKYSQQQHRGGGHVVTPLASTPSTSETGRRMHANYKIFVPPGRPDALAGFAVEKNRPQNNPVSGYYAETPASLACLYGETTWTAGCNPATLTTVAKGGSKAIAIVDAYDYPTALADLKAYSKQFGLPAPTAANFTVTWPTSTKPSPDANCANENGWNCWASEAALDIEMAHAMAPSAHIYLVEANSNSDADLFAAVTLAASLVAAKGGGEVSMSWEGSESSDETTADSVFLGTNVVFFASTGDSEGTGYPSVSPNVVAVGGTTLSRSPITLNIEDEITWEDTGGGYSEYEAVPSYQQSLLGSGAPRGVPDISAVGNPRTGVWVYDSYQTLYNSAPAPWNIFGGTSVASPLVAAIVNHAGHFAASSNAELTTIYGAGLLSANFRDIDAGTCGYYEGWVAVTGWDPCSGVGAPYGTAGK